MRGSVPQRSAGLMGFQARPSTKGDMTMRSARVKGIALVWMIALVGVAQVACQSTDSATSQSEMAQVSPGALALCTACGQFKGTADCCQAGQATCAACGLTKGSPGCCRIDKDSAEPVAVCLSCGHIKGDAMCCQPGQLKCDSCGLVKGSPGCCKIPASSR